MGMAASKLFIERAFAGDSKEAAEKTIEYIKEAMSFRIPKMTWLDRQTRNLAIQKVFSLTDKIGYPDFVMDPKKVTEEYEGLNIDSDDFFTNVVNSNFYDVGKNLKDIKKPVDRTKWEMTPQVRFYFILFYFIYYIYYIYYIYIYLFIYILNLYMDIFFVNEIKKKKKKKNFFFPHYLIKTLFFLL